MSTRGGRDHTGRERTATAQGPRPTLRQRGVDATRSLREALNLPADASDASIMGTALAEAAAREIRRNPQFASEVRRTYDELAAMRRQSGTSSQPKAQQVPPLVPIRTDLPYRKSDPYAPPDPAYLIQAYGRHQLPPALQDYTVEKLKMTAAALERQYPGTKPVNRGRKDALIAYIVEHTPAE